MSDRLTPLILVVDDTRIYRRIAADLLGQVGFRVVEAACGEDGLAVATAEVPDLVLLDITMPGIDGIETCRRLKALPATADVPIIFCSALDDLDQVVTGLEAGASDYVTKPFRPAELLARIRTHVRLKLLQDEQTRLYRQLDEKRRQLEAELARAGRVQAELLPRDAPLLPGFELAARCVPAREVGGDYYSWQEPAPGILTLTVADVMGKGMPAALLMATARAAVRAAARHQLPAPAVDLAATALEDDLERSGSFVTLFHAQLDVAARSLAYVDAGHGHAFVRRAGGRPQCLAAGGLPLGVLRGETYHQASITLGMGDALVVYSDGLVDARPDLTLDVQAIASHLADAGSAAEMVDRLVELADLSRPPPDDLTVVVLRCRAEA